jgi:putative phosphoesterase
MSFHFARHGFMLWWGAGRFRDNCAGSWIMKIGLVSDTHGYLDPQLPALLDGVDSILHAGDVGSRGVLDDLGRIADVRAVRGNVDPAGLNLPPLLKVRFGNVQIEIMHQLPVSQEDLKHWHDGSSPENVNRERRDRFLESFDPATKVVVFGHSHSPCLVTVGHRLFFNPGSCGKKRFTLPRCFGLLEVFPQGIQGAIIGLEGQDKPLPASVWLPVGEYGDVKAKES